MAKDETGTTRPTSTGHIDPLVPFQPVEYRCSANIRLVANEGSNHPVEPTVLHISPRGGPGKDERPVEHIADCHQQIEVEAVHRVDVTRNGVGKVVHQSARHVLVGHLPCGQISNH